MAGRHAKRTTVRPARTHRGRPVPDAFIVDFASFDRPSSSLVKGFDAALDLAHRFEVGKARARFIEANRRAQPLSDVG